MSEHGHVVDVQILKLGDALVSDTASGATSLVVGDIADFDEDGGTLYLNGEVIAYTAADDDTGTITLSAATTVDSESGDPVNVWDTRLESIATEHVAHVEIDGEDEGDLIEATVAQHLIDELPGGIRGLRGESVRLEEEDDDWRVVDVLGKPSDKHGILFRNLDTFVLPADGSQNVELTYTPIDGSEHVYWNGLQQRRTTDWVRTGTTVTILGTEAQADDTIDVEYAYIDGGEAPSGGTPAVVTERYYLTGAGAADVSPAFGALWDDTDDAVRLPLATSPTGTSDSLLGQESSLTSPIDVLCGQWVGPDTLDAGTLQGTMSLVVVCQETTTDSDSWLQARAFVVSSDGSTVRGELFSGVATTVPSADANDPNYEFAVSPNPQTTRILEDVPLAPVVAQAGDRVVLEVGSRSSNTTSVAVSSVISINDSDSGIASDYPLLAGQAADSTKRTWVEFAWEVA